MNNTIVKGLVATAFLALSGASASAARAAENRACGAPNTVAAATYTAEPEYPVIAMEQGAYGTAYVQVDLLASGRIAGTSIVGSSGNPQLDRAALAAANRSEFAPERIDCTPVAGSYLFVVSFAR